MTEVYEKPDKYKHLVYEMSKWFNHDVSEEEIKEKRLEEYFLGIKKAKQIFLEKIRMLECDSYGVNVNYIKEENDFYDNELEEILKLNYKEWAGKYPDQFL